MQCRPGFPEISSGTLAVGSWTGRMPTASMRTPRIVNACPRVAVCVDKTGAYGRGVLRGIAEYVELHGPWSLCLDHHASGHYARDWLLRWKGDGIRAYVESPEVARHLKRAGIPAVEVFGTRRDLGLPQVANDDPAIGVLAAEHLLERRTATPEGGISRGGTGTPATVRPGFRISSSSHRAASNPTRADWSMTLDKGGSAKRQVSSSLSTPSTAISSGTAIPARRQTSSRRSASRSLQARIAAGRGNVSSHRPTFVCVRSQPANRPGF